MCVILFAHAQRSVYHSTFSVTTKSKEKCHFHYHNRMETSFICTKSYNEIGIHKFWVKVRKRFSMPCCDPMILWSFDMSYNWYSFCSRYSFIVDPQFNGLQNNPIKVICNTLLPFQYGIFSMKENAISTILLTCRVE